MRAVQSWPLPSPRHRSVSVDLQDCSLKRVPPCTPSALSHLPSVPLLALFSAGRSAVGRHLWATHHSPVFNFVFRLQLLTHSLLLEALSPLSRPHSTPSGHCQTACGRLHHSAVFHSLFVFSLLLPHPSPIHHFILYRHYFPSPPSSSCHHLRPRRRPSDALDFPYPSSLWQIISFHLEPTSTFLVRPILVCETSYNCSLLNHTRRFSLSLQCPKNNNS